jgi:hypothetical protein
VQVVDVLAETGIVVKVARLRPIAIIIWPMRANSIEDLALLALFWLNVLVSTRTARRPNHRHLVCARRRFDLHAWINVFGRLDHAA